ncbi:MAG: YncE family protein, partial [Microcystis panniformis]
VFASASRSPDQTSNEPNQVVVINPKTTNDQTEIVAKIPISSNGVFLRPWGIATTPDLTRAYVTLRNGTIALIDAQTFQQVDINPSTDAIDAIALPTGALSEQITISPDGSYLFAADERAGTIYAVNIAPNSRYYHSVQTFAIDNANFGLRGMTVSQDGKL